MIFVLMNTDSPLKSVLVRVVQQGEGYGRIIKGEGYALTHKASEPLVEFYDYTASAKFGPLGQFVSRYFIETLLERDEGGLCLDGKEPKWNLNAAAMDTIRENLKLFKLTTDYTPEPSIDELFAVEDHA
jgi:hypothetical protein